MEQLTETITDRYGNAVPNIDVLVKKEDGTPATLYFESGGAVIANPVKSDTLGRISFAAANGKYTLITQSPNVSSEEWPFSLYDPMDVGAFDSSLVSFMQSGAGAVARPVQDELRERVSVAQYGAIGDGVTDSTAAIQKAIAHVETIAYLAPGGARPAVIFPAGAYMSRPLVANRRIALVGEGRACTSLRLINGETGSLLTLNAEDIAGTSIDDASHSIITGLTLVGNRVDSVTTGASHGINCPDTAWSQATQYSTAFRGSDIEIQNFTGNGIRLGANRNWMLLSDTVVRYCNDNLLETLSYDNRIVNCDFGLAKNFGVRISAGGANSFVGCNIYYNTINIVVNQFANSPSWFVNCSIDYALQNGANISGSSAEDAYSFIGGRFYGNSRAGANLYSDILVGGAERVKVMGVDFLLGPQKVKYLIETGSVAQVHWIGNAYDASGGAGTPYQTAITNDFSKLFYAGANDAYLGSAGNGTLSVFANGEAFRTDGTFNRNYKPVRIENTNPRIWNVVTGAAANEGKWATNYGATVYQELLSDDAETGFNAARILTRSGNTLTQQELRGTAIKMTSTTLGFYGGTPAAKPTITGSRSGNAALADLLVKLAALGLITDSTTA